MVLTLRTTVFVSHLLSIEVRLYVLSDERTAVFYFVISLFYLFAVLKKIHWFVVFLNP